jgi:hypothetical protein
MRSGTIASAGATAFGVGVAAAGGRVLGGRAVGCGGAGAEQATTNVSSSGKNGGRTSNLVLI